MSVFRRVVLVLAAFLAVFATTGAAAAAVRHPAVHKAAAPVGQQCPGNRPGLASHVVQGFGSPVAFDPNVGGYYSDIFTNTTWCLPAGWEVLTMQALPGMPVYAVRTTDQQWVNWTYTDADGNPVNPYSGVPYTATPHPVATWVFLGYQY